MPSQPAWFHRVEEILSAPRAMTSTRLDRQAVEKLFGVGQRCAPMVPCGLALLRSTPQCIIQGRWTSQTGRVD